MFAIGLVVITEPILLAGDTVDMLDGRILFTGELMLIPLPLLAIIAPPLVNIGGRPLLGETIRPLKDCMVLGATFRITLVPTPRPRDTEPPRPRVMTVLPMTVCCDLAGTLSSTI